MAPTAPDGFYGNPLVTVMAYFAQKNIKIVVPAEATKSNLVLYFSKQWKFLKLYSGSYVGDSDHNAC